LVSTSTPFIVLTLVKPDESKEEHARETCADSRTATVILRLGFGACS
jgi:hypothetical protein